LYNIDSHLDFHITAVATVSVQIVSKLWVWNSVHDTYMGNWLFQCRQRRRRAKISRQFWHNTRGSRLYILYSISRYRYHDMRNAQARDDIAMSRSRPFTADHVHFHVNYSR